MIIELEINGARVIISGDNLTVNVTGEDKPATSQIGAVQIGHAAKASIGLPSPAQIKQLRKSLKLSQNRFAASLGVAQATVCRWELGYEKPSGPSTILLAAMLDAKRETAA
jgi:putative transcriptional regulator